MKLKITIENRIYEVEVEASEADPSPAPAPTRPLTSIRPPLPGESSPSGQGGSDKLGRSPVAGVVVKIPVQLGQQVRAGDTVVVLEAMKMETNITAPCSGTLTTVSVKIGDSVRTGQSLFELE